MEVFMESPEKTLRRLGVNEKTGLDAAHVLENRQKYGINAFSRKKADSLWKRIWDATCEPMLIMLILAALIGMIPESGPHMVFISLFAGGYVPFSVLLTSSMSQDGHTSLPLLASSTRSFLVAKVVNAVFAILIGSVFYLFGL